MIRVAVYSIVRDRPTYTRKSFKALRSMSGIEFNHFVADNGSGAETVRLLKSMASDGKIHKLILNNENLGQNLAANALLDEIKQDYDYIVRWDNDMMPRTRRFLKKLVRVADNIRDYQMLAVLTPKITKLKFPPQPTRIVDVGSVTTEQIQIAGGACRLHPREIFEEFLFSRFGPLGFGEANEIADLCAGAEIPILRVPHLEVEHMHGEDKQREENPDEFTWERREVGRYVSYGL